MASFTALNIEPDDQVDDEVDNTRELQIEDALKLYQTALKLHSQGSNHYAQAVDAYQNLLNSDIFKYPESVTEFNRIESHPELEATESSFVADLDLVPAEDDASSTLPQILYLSHKNHGQFILDCVKARLQHPNIPPEAIMDKRAIDYQARAALENFALGLARDESDTELWRKAARMGATLGSRRIARYCLEAAVEIDDDPTVAEVEPPSLEEGFAGEQLLQQLDVLSDKPSLLHPIMAPFLKKKMPDFLMKYTDPYPFLPDPTKVLGLSESRQAGTVLLPMIIEVPVRSWAALGMALRAVIVSPWERCNPGVTIRFPQTHEGLETATRPEMLSSAVVQQDQIMKDSGLLESPTADSSDQQMATPIADKSEDQTIEIATTTTTTTSVPLVEHDTSTKSISLPTRKRSQSAAGIQEAADDENGAQKRSKRIRNRADTTEEIDLAVQYVEQLKGYKAADEDLFEFVNGVLAKFGVENLGSYQSVEAALEIQVEVIGAERQKNVALRDLRTILRGWAEDKESTFVNGSAADILGSSAGSASAGLSTFLEHSKSSQLKLGDIPTFLASEGVSEFAELVNAQWVPIQDVAFLWLKSILTHYKDTLWPEELKSIVALMISFVDLDIFNILQFQYQSTVAEGVESNDSTSSSLGMIEELVQTLFELHLDVVSRITNPSSLVDNDARILAKERLDRWATFSTNIMESHKGESKDELTLRFFWASVLYATMTENVSREHKVLLWTEVQEFLQEVETPSIALPNNAVMPDISIQSARAEVSRLTTLDFFFNLFQTDDPDPLAVIEALEPVLDPQTTHQPGELGDLDNDPAADNNMPTALREMWKFLKSGSTALRLFLWQRLRDAYLKIEYTTKVFSCYLRCIEIIVEDLSSADYVESSDQIRHHKILVWLKALDDLLVKALTLALNSTVASFEIIDERHVKSTCSALAQLNRILHTGAIFDDEVRVGMTQLPQTPAHSLHGSHTLFVTKIREMQVHTWSLQYAMVKEAMAQNQEIFINAPNDQADFLALTHYALGLRKYCKMSNKIFIKMMKVELLRLKAVDRWEDYLGQVLFDLYGIRLGIGTYLLDDHGCPTEQLDKRTVMNIAEEIIGLANKMQMKDLLKHELRATIEKMQAAVGPHKTTPQMTHNLRNYTEFLKSSIHPLDMYKALKGQVQVDSLPVSSPESPLANKGWYFLLGMIALAKFRSQKRTGPGTQTDDLKVAATFLRLQLQFSGDQWETWYRLAQCFDYELEEEVLWSADKINNHRQELVKLQRSSIHCYTMALSTAVQTADNSDTTAEKIRGMYYDFGLRLYASSREPFSMEAFWLDDFEKHMSGQAGMYKKPLHEEMRRFKVWQYAATLFRRSIADKVNNWTSHFMLGKCLWKMYCTADEGDTAHLDSRAKPSMHSVLSAFTAAIRAVPKPKDSRQESVLEPHYKLVSVVHKFVCKGHLSPQAGADLLQEQPYAIRKGEKVTIAQNEDWEHFILECLRHLRNADKSHWQHRMIARVVSILFDESNPDYAQASAARHEFRESIFTKTMHIQVWKPEAERPGRHCVYMERYTRLMIKLLRTVNDKANMEQLAKRVRKKAHDFFMFNQVWTDCCSAYIRLIRRAAEVPPNMDEIFKAVSHDEYEISYQRLIAWMDDSNTASHPVLEALRETIELKKLNANQMKGTPIDDLISDCWAVLHTQVFKTLPDVDKNGNPLPPIKQTQTEGELIDANVNISSVPIPPQPLVQSRSSGPMSLNNLVMDMGNGTQIPVPVTVAAHSQAAEVPRARKLGISRREVLRRAEMAINRLSEGQRSGPAGRPRISEIEVPILGSNAPPLQHTNSDKSGTSANLDSGVARDLYGDGQDESGINEEDQNEGSAEHGQDEAADEQGDDESSEKGPLQESADDESDLSDVPDMDDEMQARIFAAVNEEGRGSGSDSERTPLWEEEKDGEMEE